MPLTIGVLASTKGTDLQAIIDAIHAKRLKDVTLAVVVSNKADCLALERARTAGIEAVFLDAAGKSREEYDQAVATVFDEHHVEFIIMIGYMRLVSPWFVKKYEHRIMNIHPSLLPAFPGMDRDVHQEILDYGCKVTGCTLHFVDEGTDTGPIVLQKAVNINEDETVDSLKEKVQAAEQQLLIQGIELFRDGKIKVVGRKVHLRQSQPEMTPRKMDPN